MCLRVVRALRACVLYVLTYLKCLRSFVPLLCTCLHFLHALCAFIFLRALGAFITCLHFNFTCLHFFIQINELTCDYSSFLLFNPVIYHRLSSIFTIINLLSYSRSCFGDFWFILPRSCLFQLVAAGYGLFHLL